MLSTIRSARISLSAARYFSATSITRTTAGYGDPQDEKIVNKTPTPKDSHPSSQPDPHPKGKGKGTGSSSGMTDPEVAGKTGLGKSGEDKKVKDKEVKETKKIGEKPEKEEVGGAGVIGG